MLGEKTFEFRNNDRGFQKGDTVTLQEFDPNKIQAVSMKMKLKGNESSTGAYTGRYIMFEIGYVLPVNAEYVVFSLNKIKIEVEA